MSHYQVMERRDFQLLDVEWSQFMESLDHVFYHVER